MLIVVEVDVGLSDKNLITVISVEIQTSKHF